MREWINILESYLDGGRAPLYHWTYPEAARYILEQGKIRIGATDRVCVTRDKNFAYNKSPVRITLDADKIRRNLRIDPFDYAKSTPWHSGVEPRGEREERIHGDVPISAIVEITIFDNGTLSRTDYSAKQTQALIDNAKRLGIPLTMEKQVVLAETEADQPEVPPLLYHGTTPYNAALIVISGHIEVNESRDDDDHDDHSVCTTERADVAEWFYDVARAVDQPFGFVFHIDTSKIKDHMRPFEAETAGVPEYEWRVYGDIPLSAVVKITLAGYEGTTKAAMRDYVERMERGYGYDHYSSSEEIVSTIMSLIKKSS